VYDVLDRFFEWEGMKVIEGRRHVGRGERCEGTRGERLGVVAAVGRHAFETPKLKGSGFNGGSKVK